MKNILLILSLIICTQTMAQKEVKVPTIAFKVPLGETITRGAVAITLAEILEDSRCPSDVTCVWAGRARVKVLVTIDRKETEEHIVLFERGKQTEIASTATCTFKAMKLAPYPTAATKNNLAYELLIAETCTISEEE